MNLSKPPTVLASAILAFSLTSLVFAQAPAQPAGAAAGRGGGGRGGAAGGMTPAQTAAVGAIDTLLQARVQAVNDARTALNQAAFTNRAEIQSRADALAAAEQALANSRAEAFTLLQGTPSRLDAVQIQTVVNSAATGGALVPAAGGGGGGGRGGGGFTLPGGPQLSDPAYANFEAIFPKAEPQKALTPEEQHKKFILQPGYKMDLVLADPTIKEPTNVAFDGNGRMYVLEDRGYMLTIDAQGQRDPNSLISFHEDVNNDGVYEKSTVFVDKLVFPRFVTPFGPNAILTMETDQDEVWKYTDTNNDGKADKKDLFTTGFGQTGNVEHQQASLTYTMDNWMYPTVKSFRVRWTPTGVLKEVTGGNGGQWGITQDNDGRQYSQGGASGVPATYQFPMVYGNLGLGNQWDADFTIPWGAPVRIADMQGGLTTVRMPDGSLNRVTGSAGNEIVRAHRMPADLQGELLYGEPIARIVRRIHPYKEGGVTMLKNYYEGNEFIKSTDPLFRPVEMANAPDGTIYIVDMYRGIIQESNWSAPPTTYLRARVDQYQLDKLHSMGRIWRLSYEGMARDTRVPRMQNEAPAQLVAHLSHPNGWWRDTAQQFLVLKQDKSVVPALQRLVTSTNRDALLGRFHALWTLEGLNALDAKTVRDMMKDPEPRMRVQALRASETLYKAGDKSFAAEYATLAKDSNVDVAVQALLTVGVLKLPNGADIARSVQTPNAARAIQVVSNTVINPAAAGGGGGRGGPAINVVSLGAHQASFERGQTIYSELCASCHGANGLGTPKPEGGTIAPALAASSRVVGHRDYVVNVLLKGLSGPIPGTSFNDLMIPMGTNNDQWIADVSTYIRNGFGTFAPAVTPEQVARVRAASATRTTPWTIAELETRVPQQLVSFAGFSASHNAATARLAASAVTPWNANAAQQPGPIWLQIDLEAPTNVAEIQFTAGAGGGGGGRGGRGAGGGAVAPAAATPPGTPPLPLPAVGTAQPPAAVPAAVPAAGAGRSFRVEVSTNGTTWTPAATVAGTDGLNTITLAQPVAARHVRIVQTEGSPSLSVGGLRIYNRAQ